jgi:hypothetical protein
MKVSNQDSTISLPLPAMASGRLSAYVLSFGLTTHDAEDIVQETFFSLFRHLQLGRSRRNLVVQFDRAGKSGSQHSVGKSMGLDLDNTSR